MKFPALLLVVWFQNSLSKKCVITSRHPKVRLSALHVRGGSDEIVSGDAGAVEISSDSLLNEAGGSANQSQSSEAEDVIHVAEIRNSTAGERNPAKSTAVVEDSNGDEFTGINFDDWSDLDNLSDLDISDLEDLLEGEIDELSDGNMNENEIKPAEQNFDGNSSKIFEEWLSRELTSSPVNQTFETFDDSFEFTEDASQDIASDNDTDVASMFTVRKQGSVNELLRFRLQLLRIIILHTSAGLYRKSCHDIATQVKFFSLASMGMMMACAALNFVASSFVKKKNNLDLIEVEMNSLFREKMRPLKVGTTVAVYDATCLNYIRNWCAVYAITGLMLSFILHDFEPLFIGCGLSVLRYLSEPVFLSNVLQFDKGKLRRPFIRPNLLNQMLGAPHSWMPKKNDVSEKSKTDEASI